ncbi:MAG: PAS domain S-box protein [Chloroflexi bacterium]|nr:PAS domain S-box protein [Chloroflexota bacterium]
MSCFRSLTPLWGYLIEPTTPIQDTDARRKSRLQAALLLALALALSLFFVLQHLSYGVSLKTLIAQILALALTFSLYGLSRQGHYRFAAHIGTLIGTILIFALSVSQSPTQASVQLYYLIAIFAFAMTVLPRSWVIRLAIVHISGILVYGLFIHPDVATLARGPLTFYLITSSLLLLGLHYSVRLQAEQQALLAASEARYRSLIENMLDIAYSLSLDGKILAVNRVTETLLGWTEAELVGKNFLDFLHPDELPSAAGFIQQSIGGGKPPTFQVRVLTRSGEYKWLESNSAARMENGRVIEIFGVARDISARLQAEDQKIQLALERERLTLIENFVLAMSHDFRTSLATIETSRHLIERKINETDRMRLQPKLDQIQTAIHHMTEQLQNLRALLPLANLAVEACDLNALVAGEVAEFAPLARQKQQTLRFTSDSGLPPARVDGERVRQAVAHLLRNAVHYTPDGGTITVRTAQVEKSVLIEIRDTGMGITPQQLQHIFELFYRGDEARSLQSGGVGVGLNIVRAVAVAHGGTINVESCPGKGSFFTLALPLRSE